MPEEWRGRLVGRTAARRGWVDPCDIGGGCRKQRILSPRSPSSPSVFIKPSKWLAFICSCDVSVKPAGSGKMIDVRSIPFGTRGAIDGPIGTEEKRGRKEWERKRKRRREKAFVDPKRFSREREREVADEGRGSQRDWNTLGGVFRGTYWWSWKLKTPGEPKWVWLSSLVPIVSVGWNFGTKWRACGDTDDRGYRVFCVHPFRSSYFLATYSSPFSEWVLYWYYKIMLFRFIFHI